MSAIGWTTLAASLTAGFLAFAVLLLWRRAGGGVPLAMGLLCLAAEAAFQCAAVRATTLEAAVRWQNWSLAALGLAPGPWIAFAVTFARGNHREFLWRWFPAVLGLAVPAAWIGYYAARQGVTFLITEGTPMEWAFKVAWPATVLHLITLLTAVLVLMHIEGTFRASVGTARWRIKFAVIGLVLLFGARVYGSSQVLLYSGIAVSLAAVTSAALVLASFAIGYSLVRSRLEGVDIYPSTKALHQTVTTVLVGVYLLIVGILAQLINLVGGDAGFPLKALVILVGMAVLGSLGMSDRVRQRVRLFVSRHFTRPVHDYRQVWSAVTERTAALTERDPYCRAMTKLMSGTFDALSVSVWLPDDRANRLLLAASTSIPGHESSARIDLSPEQADQLAAYFQEHPEPTELDTASEPCLDLLSRQNPARFPNGGSRYAMPLISGGELAGVVVLGDRVKGLAMGADDFDLLKCLGEHVGASLRNLKLSGRLLELREFEAFQTMSTFLVHDLKNTASTLALMLRNMGTHFDNPEFREDAMRGLGKSVEHINDLIARLSSLRGQLELNKQLADVNDLVGGVLAPLDGQPGIRILRKLQPMPPFLVDRRQIESVLTNLLINAREALGQEGTIEAATAAHEGWAILSVRDNGCGIAPEFLARSLFRPFQTTKKKGLGIGMFQSKMIVEAHGGRIEVESELNQGTLFRVLLPMLTEPEPISD